MKAFKLDEYTREITYLDIKNDVEEYCKILQCDCLDFATFASAPGLFRIVAIVDDVGALIPRQPTCYYASGLGCLYGTVIFVRQYFNSPDFSDIEMEDLKIIQCCQI